MRAAILAAGIAIFCGAPAAMAQTSYDKFQAPTVPDLYTPRPIGTIDYGLGSTGYGPAPRPSGTIDYGLSPGSQMAPPPRPYGTIDYGLNGSTRR